MHPYGQIFLVLRAITAVYGVLLLLKFAVKAALLFARGAGQ